MDVTQIVLFIIIVILAIMLSALGVQLFFVLRGFNKTVSKANKVLDDAEIITHNISSPISSLSSLTTGVKTGASIVKLLKKIISKDEEEGKKNKND